MFRSLTAAILAALAVPIAATAAIQTDRNPENQDVPTLTVSTPQPTATPAAVPTATAAPTPRLRWDPPSRTRPGARLATPPPLPNHGRALPTPSAPVTPQRVPQVSRVFNTELVVRPPWCFVDACLDIHRQHNMRTDAGAFALAQLMGATTGTPFNVLVLSTDPNPPNASDVVCPGEITTGNLTRKAGSFTYSQPPQTPGGQFLYVESVSWVSSIQTVAYKLCAFNGAGTLGYESPLGGAGSTIIPGALVTLNWGWFG